MIIIIRLLHSLNRVVFIRTILRTIGNIPFGVDLPQDVRRLLLVERRQVDIQASDNIPESLSFLLSVGLMTDPTDRKITAASFVDILTDFLQVIWNLVICLAIWAITEKNDRLIVDTVWFRMEILC